MAEKRRKQTGPPGTRGRQRRQTGPPGTALEISQAAHSAAQFNANFDTFGGGAKYGNYETASRQEWAGLKRVYSKDTPAIWSSTKFARATPGGMRM